MPGPGNFGAVLGAVTEPAGADPFLIEATGRTWTYGAVDDLAARMAHALGAAGASPGKRVLVQVDKSPAAVALYLACLRAGTVHVPLNPAFTLDELDHFVTDADPAVIVADPNRHHELVATGGPAVLTLDGNGNGSLIDAAVHAAPQPVVQRADDDVAALLYTSGTTGRPKGAALTHANLRHNAEALHRVWRFGPHDHLLHTLPIFHVHGLFVALHCAMLAAAPVTFLPRFDVDDVVNRLPGATVMMGVPTQYQRLLDDPRLDTGLVATMRLFTSGSAPLSEGVFEAFAERTGHRILERYGMSEAGIITSNPYDGPRIAGTVGHTLPGVELRVVDPEGAPVPVGATGSVEIRGPHLFSGYWRLPDATDAAHRGDGFFVTGDVGSLDDDGRLTLQGRAGDMIISGGENVYPKEIELVLDAVPGIIESAVVGLPHPDFGDGVTAMIVADDDYDTGAIDSALRHSLARYKHPKQIVVVDALPRNAMGKVQKQVLRAEFAALYDPSST